MLSPVIHTISTHTYTQCATWLDYVLHYWYNNSYTMSSTIATPPTRARTSTVTTIGSTITAISPKSIGVLEGGLKNATGSPVTRRPVIVSNVFRLFEMTCMSVLAGMRGSPLTGIGGGTDAATPMRVIEVTDTI